MSTRIGEALRDLGDAIDAIESAGGAVTDVEPTTEGTAPDGAVELGLRVQLPLLDGETPEGIDLVLEQGSLDDDGSLVLDLVASAATPDASVAVIAASAQGDDGGADDTVAFDGDEPDGDQQADATEADSVPAYRDPARLRAVYESYDSFPEMTEALGVDVTPQTVRRHMIDHGIHDPEAQTRSGEGEAEGSEDGADATEPNTTDAAEPSGNGTEDGSESPTTGGAEAGQGGAEEPPSPGDLDGVDLEELKEAVRTSRTIHEVGQRLGVPRERAFRLLNTLDLVDLVSGRLETADRPISTEELDQRIARATAAGE